MVGTWIVVAVLVLATGWALVDRRRRGTFRTATPEQADWHRRLGTTLGDDVTFVQFSSAFCAPCRATRLLLSDVAEREHGIKHIEIDAEKNLELVRELGVLSTPTTFVLDGDGRTIARSAGTPKRDQVMLLVQGIRNSHPRR
jgi:thiol-disulfide isomerase/thioredoxin